MTGRGGPPVCPRVGNHNHGAETPESVKALLARSCTASAGTAVGTGFGTTTAGVPLFFTTTVGGTVVFTVSGTLTRFQLELTSFHPTSYIPTAGVTVTRAADIATAPIGSWCAASPAVTLCFEGIIPWSGAAGIWALWQLDDGTSNNRLGAWLQPGNTAVTMMTPTAAASATPALLAGPSRRG